MRRSFLAILSLLCGSASAQSSAQLSGLTLYGVVDMPVEYVNRMGRGVPTVVDNQLSYQPGGKRIAMPTTGGLSGARWGLRGTEDLGGGLSALFVLESGFGLDNGVPIAGGRLFGRQAYVGLQSELGRLSLGRQYTSLFDVLANFSPNRYAVLYEPIAWQLGPNYREDNMLKYTGSFGPIMATAHYSFGTGLGSIAGMPLANGGNGETPGNLRDNTAWGAGVAYLANGFGAALGYDQWNPAAVAGQPGKASKAAGALSYATGLVKVMAGYRWGSADAGDGTTLLRDDYYWAGANYQLTPALGLTLGYAYARLRLVRLSATAPATEPANPWQVNFIADYDLSKRTDVYLTTAYARNAGLNFDTSALGFANGYFPTAGQRGMFGVAVGVRHKF
ncbi:porin [Cupriavidus alkaliphilus]|uniref:Putative porin n=1 Tax=Cupriavidus alkaliphilus TaxID=942866 RepID=A0A7W4VE29_9BURK|nr:porin [Cupriavidus alkaliphilus]MBB3009891.1 putative porin [Cupriavidus alkaliphilus]